MKGVTIQRASDVDMYLLKFDTYQTLVSYLNLKTPSQISICFDGEELTASIPVQAYRVRYKEVKE